MARTDIRPKPAETSRPAEMSKALRRYLYFTATMTGAAIMVIEILGAKLLSPYMGTSHFVWTAQIAVTLVALACGYYVGGSIADKRQKLGLLYWAILVAAAYCAFSIFIIEPVAYWALDLNLAAGSLIASAVLFFVPLSLLAMTGPFLVRMITATVLNVGGNVGRLTALGTLGSFAGTLLVGYAVIPFLPNSTTLYITSLVLALICCGYFVFFQRKEVLPSLLLMAAIAGMGALALAAQANGAKHMRTLFSGNSHFGRMQVVENASGSIRFYLNDNLVQNTYDPTERKSASLFTYMLSGMAEAYVTNIQSVLCVGMGIGIVPMHFASKGAQVDVVEINPAVAPMARQWFDFDPARVMLTIDDGRHFVNACHKRYDVVVLDAFLGDSSPSHLMTREAFAAVKRVLRPGGALVINMFGEVESGKDFFTASLYKTLASVFKGVRMHSTGDGAVFFTAMDVENPSFAKRPSSGEVHSVVRVEFEQTMSSTISINPASGIVLTDDYNPVEYFDAHNREQIRRRLAGALKDM